jgi:hypothetical protein
MSDMANAVRIEHLAFFKTTGLIRKEKFGDIINEFYVYP